MTLEETEKIEMAHGAWDKPVQLVHALLMDLEAG